MLIGVLYWKEGSIQAKEKDAERTKNKANPVGFIREKERFSVYIPFEPWADNLFKLKAG